MIEKEKFEVIDPGQRIDPLKEGMKLYRVLEAWRLLGRTGMTSLGLAYVLKTSLKEVQKELLSGVDTGRLCTFINWPGNTYKRTHYYGHFCSIIQSPVWYPKKVDGGQCFKNKEGEAALARMKDVDTPFYKGVLNNRPTREFLGVQLDEMLILLYAKKSLKNLVQLNNLGRLNIGRMSQLIKEHKEALLTSFARKWEPFKEERW